MLFVLFIFSFLFAWYEQLYFDRKIIENQERSSDMFM